MLDEATAINQQLRGELQRLGKDVDKMLADRGTLSKALEDAKARLDELRKAQAAARGAGHRSSRTSRSASRRSSTPGSCGSRRGAVSWCMEVTGDLLFEAGHAELRTAGKGALMEVARALQSVVARAAAAVPRDVTT